MNLDKIISIVRSINEEMAIANVSGEKSLGFNPETGTPPVWKGKNKYVKGGKGPRKWWLQHLKQK